MSKTKKIVSFVLVVVMLLGVGFGAYFLFFKKDNSLTGKRAISLINETSKELNTAITTIGNGVSGKTSTGTLSTAGLNANTSLNANASLNATSSTDVSDYEHFINMVTFASSYVEMVDFAVGMSSDDTIEFNKIYMGVMDGVPTYLTLYYTSDLIVFEFAVNAEDDGDKIVINTYGIIDYDKEKDKPTAFNFIIVDNESSEYGGTTTYDFSMRMYSINFDSKMFNCYETYMYNLNEYSIVENFRSKLAKGELNYDDIKDYVDFDNDFYIYSGNIANNVDDIKMATHKDATSRKALFNTYSKTISHLEMVATSKIDFDNIDNISNVGSEILQYFVASQNRYMCGVDSDNRLCFIDATSSQSWQEWDKLLINKLKTLLNEMSVSDADGTIYDGQIKITISDSSTPETEFNLLKSTVGALEDYYTRHKDDQNYVSLMLGRCGSEMNFPSEGSKVDAYIDFDKNEDSFTYNIKCGSLGDSTSYSIRATLYLGDGR